MGRTVLLVALLAVFVAVLILVPEWQVPAEIKESQKRFEIEDAARKTLAQILGGGFFLVTAYFTARTLKATEANLELARENARKADDKQIAERLTKATENLGSDKIAVRLGGIYSLGRIAIDSGADRGTVVEILCAFVRQSSPWSGSVDALEGAGPAPFWGGKRVPPDIQAALTVLTRCGPWEKEGIHIDLRETDLRGALLKHADLRFAYLDSACLAGAMLDGADLSGADLMHADLRQAQFKDALFRNAVLAWSDLRTAYLNGASFEGADLEDVGLDGVFIDSRTVGLAMALEGAGHSVRSA